VIVSIVDLNGVFALELERQSPVSAHPYSPMTFLVAFQWMELPTWNVHVLGTPRNIQSLQLTGQPSGVSCLNAGPSPFQEGAFDALVAEALDHRDTVSRYDTRVNQLCPNADVSHSFVRIGESVLCYV
jgi:hypothetical protein